MHSFVALQTKSAVSIKTETLKCAFRQGQQGLTLQM